MIWMEPTNYWMSMLKDLFVIFGALKQLVLFSENNSHSPFSARKKCVCSNRKKYSLSMRKLRNNSFNLFYYCYWEAFSRMSNSNNRCKRWRHCSFKSRIIYRRFDDFLCWLSITQWWNNEMLKYIRLIRNSMLWMSYWTVPRQRCHNSYELLWR